MTRIKVIDTFSVSYDSMEELLESQHRIEQTLYNYIQEKRIADSYRSDIRLGKDKRYHLSMDLLSEVED